MVVHLTRQVVLSDKVVLFISQTESDMMFLGSKGGCHDLDDIRYTSLGVYPRRYPSSFERDNISGYRLLAGERLCA